MDFPKHTLQKNAMGGYVLMRDGYQTICPFLPAIVLYKQGTLAGTMEQTINPNPCCSLCPKFNLVEIAGQPHVELQCGAEATHYPVTIVEYEEKTESGIIKLNR